MQESPSSSSSLFIILADKHALAFSAVQHGAARLVAAQRVLVVLCRVSPSPLRSGGILPPPAENGAHEGLGHGSPQPGWKRGPCRRHASSRLIKSPIVWCVQQRGKVRWMGGEATRRWVPDDEPERWLVLARCLSRSAEHAPSTWRSACSRIDQSSLCRPQHGRSGSSLSTILPFVGSRGRSPAAPARFPTTRRKVFTSSSSSLVTK